MGQPMLHNALAGPYKKYYSRVECVHGWGGGGKRSRVEHERSAESNQYEHTVTWYDYVK